MADTSNAYRGGFLWDESKHAARFSCIQTIPRDIHIGRPRIDYDLLGMSREALATQYATTKLKEMAAAHHIDSRTLKLVLKRAGIPLRSRSALRGARR